MKYFFIVGNHPDLSIAELMARLPVKKHQLIGQDAFVAELADELDSSELMANIGGTIKMGRVVKTLPLNQGAAFNASADILKGLPKSGKFNFGISVYGSKKITIQNLGLNLKKTLKNEGVSCRLVTSRDKTLSSVVVEQNKLTKGGCELVYIVDDRHLYIGVTEAVQPFKALSERDYGRPARDDRSGMLPPKLAQIMINLSGAKTDAVIYDPFCGSGTIVTEAMLMNFTEIIGSDISAKAVADTKENIAWTKERYKLTIDPAVFVSDARDMSKKINKDSVAAIVTETYLGPQRGTVDIHKVSRELNSLYSVVLREMATVLKKGGRAVIALPAFVRNGKAQSLNLASGAFKLRDRFLYGRADQRVWREIIVLEK